MWALNGASGAGKAQPFWNERPPQSNFDGVFCNMCYHLDLNDL